MPNCEPTLVNSRCQIKLGFVASAIGWVLQRLDGPRVETGKNLLSPNPQLGQVTESVEAEDLLTHAVVLDEPVAMAI